MSERRTWPSQNFEPPWSLAVYGMPLPLLRRQSHQMPLGSDPAVPIQTPLRTLGNGWSPRSRVWQAPRNASRDLAEFGLINFVWPQQLQLSCFYTYAREIDRARGILCVRGGSNFAKSVDDFGGPRKKGDRRPLMQRDAANFAVRLDSRLKCRSLESRRTAKFAALRCIKGLPTKSIDER
ncbi:hypothetical protein SCHPADRAFT_885111 [Schizopora paradoxa]|uniref:Uncharacterized protein n=1 Tax=Schizopora paradoxa TaxID=27342 RepID=A0A0H2S7B9_9AGAM|nr:hypothetical protein SCHPADRAFT_885111 [Schizopora paradoxa]